MAENVQNLQLQLTLQATGLKSIAGHGKKTSDPYAEVKLLFANEELFLGRTEVIKNSLSPKWTASFIFDHSVVGKDAFIEVSVVDKVGKGSDVFLGCKLLFHSETKVLLVRFLVALSNSLSPKLSWLYYIQPLYSTLEIYCVAEEG